MSFAEDVVARLSRRDSAGAWHHVMNRGIARRSVFEDRACVRYFLSRLARVVRCGDLEVHCFVFLTTHFHLLVRSPRGRLSESLRVVQNQFVRWFNRRNRRDGPLFRGRFLSRLVESLLYRRILVRYIDQNPVLAGLVVSPEVYEHGSAQRYVFKSGPRWLERSWVESEAIARTGAEGFSGRAYVQAFNHGLTRHEGELVEARLEHPAIEADPLDDLVHATPVEVQRWMERKAALADGTRPGLPCTSAEQVRIACSRAAAVRGEWRMARGGNPVLVWEVLQVALWRDIAGLRWSEIGTRASVGESSARRRYQIHRAWLASIEEYWQALTAVTSDCLRS